MREIVLDTETTGFDPESGDRIVEIACLELVRRIPSGRTWWQYINPERDMPAEAFAVHGLSTEFLSDKPKFASVAQDFLNFVDGARLVIHNAAFDMKFLNAELKRMKMPPLRSDTVIDTLALARRKHPGAQNSLDALCRRYKIDNSKRTKHGAMLDVELLAEVYLNLIDAGQAGFDLTPKNTAAQASQAAGGVTARPEALPSRLTEEEKAAHQTFLTGELKGTPLWREYLVNSEG
jgi:DNA polymerase-3 subunit epsilon